MTRASNSLGAFLLRAGARLSDWVEIQMHARFKEPGADGIVAYHKMLLCCGSLLKSIQVLEDFVCPRMRCLGSIASKAT